MSIFEPGRPVRYGETVEAGVGFRFDLGPRDLNSISITHQVTLAFDGVAVVIEAAFELTIDGGAHYLDPGNRSHLDPLFELYPDALSSLIADGDGTLRVDFASGRSIVVRNDEAPTSPGTCAGPARHLSCVGRLAVS